VAQVDSDDERVFVGYGSVFGAVWLLFGGTPLMVELAVTKSTRSTAVIGVRGTQRDRQSYELQSALQD